MPFLPSVLRIHDPGLTWLRSAARAAIVIPAVFAFANEAIGNPQLAIFAAFGSFAMLVLVEFGGPVRSRLVAYLSLAGVGAANVTVGTLCSHSAWLAAGAMAAVSFIILFSGVINGYFVAAATPALLTFILAAMVPAPTSALTARLEGWALAAGVGMAAQLLIWPLPAESSLRSDAAGAAKALAELAATELARDARVIGDRVHTAGQALQALRRRFLATPHKPSGPTGPQAALSSLVDELDWVFSLLAPPSQTPGLDICPSENAEAVAAVVASLDAAAATLQGRDERPDLERLRETRDALTRAVARYILELELPRSPNDEPITATLESAFRVRALSGASEQAATYALLASGRSSPGLDTPQAATALAAAERSLVEHASLNDIWFRNSVRGAIGLALAVYIAQRSGVQHGFWVALGTLSVLRSNALGTGWTILTALAGTAVGIALGAALVIGIGSHQTVLWAVLPFAVLLGSYAPRAISFAAGQAGFTVVLFILFNIIQPVGWRVGLVRIEDVGIGFAISLGVGILFWPRGAAALFRENLALAYARNAEYVVAAECELVKGAASADASAAAAAAAHRLDDAYRQALAERSARTDGLASVAPLVAGAARLRRAAQSIASLALMAEDDVKLVQCGANLDAEVDAMRSWYIALGEALVASSTTLPPAPHLRDADGRRRLLECIREALTSGDKAKMRSALDLVWASQHLDALWQLEEHLGRHAVRAVLR